MAKASNASMRKWKAKKDYSLKNKGLKKEVVNKMIDAKLAKSLAKQQTKQLRRTEYYKAKRTASRSAALSATIAQAEAQRANTAVEAEREKTKRLKIKTDAIQQYSNLINGEQGSENIVNPSDNSGNPSGSWNPNDVL